MAIHPVAGILKKGHEGEAFTLAIHNKVFLHAYGSVDVITFYGYSDKFVQQLKPLTVLKF